MAETRGVWGLSEAWAEKASAEWTPIDGVWVTDPDYSPPSVPYSDRGYTLGGSSTGPSSNGITSIEKLTFSNGTSSLIPATVLNPRSDEEGCSGPSQGISGAQGGPSPQKMVKFTLSNESTTGMPSSNPVGGHANPFGGNSTVAFAAAMHGTLKYTYSSSTFTQPPAASIGMPSSPVGGNWNQWGAGAQSAVAGTPNEGYWTWAKTESWFSKISYATDTGTMRVGTLLSASYMGGGGSGSASVTNAYWFGGGNNYNNWPSPYYNSMQVMPFSTLTCRLSPGTIGAANRYRGRIPNGNTECYLVGGYLSGPSPNSTTVAKVTYATETCAAHPSPINVGRQKNGGYSPSGDGAIQARAKERWSDGAAESYNFGFTVSGRNAPSPSYNSTVHKIDYSNDTNSRSPALDVPQAAQLNFGAGSTTKGYVMGGTDNSPSDGESITSRITYSTETESNLGGTLGARRYGSFAMTHGDTALYVMGGRNPDRSNCRKMSYSSETFSDIPSKMSSARYNGGAFATSTAGYAVMGSQNGTFVSIVDKITFSTDTFARIPSADMTESKFRARGLSESTAGYVVGGYTSPSSSARKSTINKMTFSSETSETISETLTSARYDTQTIGNPTNGYIAGGLQYNSPQFLSNVDKFTYSTSTIAAVGNLSQSQAQGCGISAGSDNLPFSTSPAATPTPKATIGYGEKQGRYNVPVYDHGYIGGGEGSPGASTSSDDRLMKLAFSTDTATEVPSGLSSNYRGTAKGLSSGSTAYAFFAGGADSSTSNTGESYLRRVQYSTDTADTGANITANAYNSGNQARKNMLAFGKETFGFFALGRSGSQLSSLIRLDYSNSTSSSWAWRTASPGQWPQVYDGEWNIGPSWPGPTRSNAATGGTTERAYIGTRNSADVYSNVLRWNYVYNQATTVPSGNEFKTRQRGTGDSTQTNWYIGGGNDGSNDLSSFDKMNFATETVEGLPSTNLTVAGKNNAGVNAGNSHGYWCGISATVGNKVNYSTETVSTTPISSGSNPGKFASGTSMKDFGCNFTSITNLI